MGLLGDCGLRGVGYSSTKDSGRGRHVTCIPLWAAFRRRLIQRGSKLGARTGLLNRYCVINLFAINTITALCHNLIYDQSNDTNSSTQDGRLGQGQDLYLLINCIDFMYFIHWHVMTRKYKTFEELLVDDCSMEKKSQVHDTQPTFINIHVLDSTLLKEGV